MSDDRPVPGAHGQPHQHAHRGTAAGEGAHATAHTAWRDPFGPPPFGYEEVLRGRSKRAIREGELVLEAAGIPLLIQAHGAGARLLVHAMHADHAREELSDYRDENVDWPPRRAAVPRLARTGVPGALVYCALIGVMHWMQYRGGYGVPWTDWGRMEGGAVARGELWRPFTALLLHVDLQHLVSNMVFGALFGILLAQSVGTGIGWLATLLAGAGGNALESFLVDPSHRAIGASTAIFGTLGVLTASEWTRRGRASNPWVRRAAPLVGGAILFGWLGVGDGSGRVDVLAHATGLLCGGLLGFAIARTRLPQRLGPRGQAALVAVCLLLPVAAWAWALDAAGG